ncbi:MAG TPA: universal stress protein [Thermoleophilaceae bacterium]|jgi:nucleotide-binding universal stress UspA family protein
MTFLIVVAAAALVAALVVLVIRWRDPEKLPHRITPPAERILFPLLGDTVSRSALDATLRLARAEHATLVPAYLATVPYNLPLSAPLPLECERAMPLLETIEQRAARLSVPVDSRIETGRSPRHALRQLLDEERFDRIVVPAATATSSGFGPEDIAWLLENAPGEIAVLRAEQNGGGLKHSRSNGRASHHLPRASLSRGPRARR